MTVLLVLVVLACGIGVLATFEPLEPEKARFWRIVYLGFGFPAAVGLVQLWKPKRE